MKRLIESLLELARFDSGQEVIRKDKININTLIKDCIDLVTPVANETRIIIKNNSSDVLINADYEKISQVVINLLMNAIQYNTFNGAVDISTSVENGLCLIEIKDTGIGIEEDKIDYIFERFYRIDPSRKSGNSGLGLSICRAIVTAHAGTIKVKKSTPYGSHFIIELPQ
jgi:signal transduction histidine kinase